MGEISTIAIGARAPEFTLKAANRFNSRNDPQPFSLRAQFTQAPIILEFLRGTW
jgi:hypothetical protein